MTTTTPAAASRATTHAAARLRQAPQSVPVGDTALLHSAEGAVVRHVVVTLNAPTFVCAGSRFESGSADAISSVVHGLSPVGECLRLHSPAAIRAVHVAQSGRLGYREAATAEVGVDEMAVWHFDEMADVRLVEMLIGPSTNAGLTLPVTCRLPESPPAGPTVVRS